MMTEWQPIKSAPRDGTQILLWAEAWDMTWGIQIGSFVEPEQCWSTYEGTVDDNSEDFDPKADVEAGEFDDWMNKGPTHWMPLPMPPRFPQETADD